MKKFLFTLSPKRYYFISSCFFLMLFVSGAAVAQGGGSSSDKALSYGPILGVSVNTFSNGQPQNNSTLGLNSGAFVSFSLSSHIAIQVDALYAQEGGRLLTFDAPSYIGEENWYNLKVQNRNVVLHNVNVPVLFKYKMALKGLKLAALIGPEFSYTVKALSLEEVSVFDETAMVHTYKNTDDITAETERVNFAASLGASLEVPFENKSIIIEARYRYGLSPVYEAYSYINGIPQIAGDLYSNSISLSIGLGF